jgi:putative phosphoribosyl transferase
MTRLMSPIPALPAWAEQHAIAIMRPTGEPAGAVILATGLGDGRDDAAHDLIAIALREAGLATVVVNLLTAEERAIDAETRVLRFDHGLIAKRLVDVSTWVAADEQMEGLQIGYFASGLTVAGMLIAAANHPELVRSVVSRGGQVELVPIQTLRRICADTLLMVGERDSMRLPATLAALAELPNGSCVDLVPSAGHMLDDAAALDRVATRARIWFEETLS